MNGTSGRVGSDWAFRAVLIGCSGFACCATLGVPVEPPASPPSEPARKVEPARPNPAADPSKDPMLNDPSVDETLTEMKRRERKDTAVPPSGSLPAQTAVPGAAGASGFSTMDFTVPGARVLPEGTFVSALPGKLIRGSGGEIVFVPASGASNVTSAPMMLLRCQKLAQIVSAWSGDVVGESSIGATISGQVFSYGARAYLMPTVFALGLATEEAPTIAEPKSSEPGKPRVSEPVRGDADPKVLIEKLESRPRPRRAVDRVRTSSAEIAAVTPAASTMVTPSATSAKPTRVAASLIPEGTVLTARRGRLVRSGQDSELSFAADNGPEGPEGHVQGPMVLLACRVMERMEGAAAAYGDNIALKVSGRVTIYQGRNYLMPTMYQLVKAGDVVPQQ